MSTRATRAIFIAFGAIALPVALVAACSSDNTAAPVDPSGSCSDLASRCHPYAKATTGIGHECHELGHVGDDNACAPRRAECLAACPETDAASGSHITADASTSDASVDPDATAQPGPDSGDLCTPYCQCLTDTCSTIAGYPFTGVADCVARCPLSNSAEEKACLPKWCEKAKTAGATMHTCEHAWGKLGTDECETL